MTKSGTVPTTAPVGWVFLDRHRHDGYTIRWRRGDTVAYVLSDKKLGDHGMADVLVRLRLGPPSLWARQMVPAAS